MRPVQYFTPEYLEHCRKMKPEQIVQFLEDFRQLHGPKPQAKSRLIRIKIPEPLLAAFRTKAELSGVPYQTQIKNLMRGWLTK